jgi:hypothetical protein
MFQLWQGEGVQQASKITPACGQPKQRERLATTLNPFATPQRRRTAATHHNCRRMPVLVIVVIA